MKPTHVLKAYIPGAGKDGKAKYFTIGSLFQRSNGEVVVKLDSVPTDGRWQGWVNAYPWEDEKRYSAASPDTPVKAKPTPPEIPEDDIPF